jgi:hypothetical protein
MTSDVQPDLTGRAPRFDPLKHGLFRRFKDDAGNIDHGQWSRAIAEGVPVGSCRRCGHDLTPRRPDQISPTRIDYEATCRNEECEWVMHAPGGRYLRYSSRLGERTSRS